MAQAAVSLNKTIGFQWAGHITRQSSYDNTVDTAYPSNLPRTAPDSGTELIS
ncbi:hypothetical protein [Streptomyces sp. CB00072]|uniref:hypothetical protein n=1 Tax=Streptomyces sp. CB00072 TaxID=1703928 RepID=UPI001300CD06|nr:hypothetical protein [Streptomyces sp. CB00072]